MTAVTVTSDRQTAAAQRRARRMRAAAEQASTPPRHYPHLYVLLYDDSDIGWDDDTDQPITGMGLSAAVAFGPGDHHQLFPADADIYDLDVAYTDEAWDDMVATVAGWADSHGWTLAGPIEAMDPAVCVDQVIDLHRTGDPS